MPKGLSKAIAEVERLLEQGDLLLAFDRASEQLSRHPDAEILKHRACWRSPAPVRPNGRRSFFGNGGSIVRAKATCVLSKRVWRRTGR